MLPEIEEGVYSLRVVYLDKEQETSLYYTDIYASNRAELDKGTATTKDWLESGGGVILKMSAKRKT